jgi:hypothetical protein
VTAFLVGSGVVFWVIALPILCLVTIAVVRGVKELRAERAAAATPVSVSDSDILAAEISQYLADGGAR